MFLQSIGAAFAVAVMVLAPAAPSAVGDLVSADEEVTVATPTEVTVMGLEDVEVGDTVPVTELVELAEEADQDVRADLFADEGENFAALSVVSPGTPARASFTGPSIKLAGDPAYSIYSQWWDNKRIKAAVRNGTGTWGWQHLQKHNVSLAMLQKTTQFPRNRDVSGTTITYVTPANLFTCWLGSCRVDRTMDVRVISNNTRLSDGAPRGIITAYCVGPTVCPAWVRQVAG